MLCLERLHAFQIFEEIEVPHCPAKLTIGHGLQSDCLLLRYDSSDFSILYTLQFGGRDAALLVRHSSLFEHSRTQQAAHMVRPKRRDGFLHSLPQLSRHARIIAESHSTEEDSKSFVLRKIGSQKPAHCLFVGAIIRL